MVIRIALIGVVLIAAMLVIKDGRLMRQLGVVSRCETITAPIGQSGMFKQCSEGRVDGRRDLSEHGCSVVRTVGKVDVWRCPEDN